MDTVKLIFVSSAVFMTFFLGWIPALFVADGFVAFGEVVTGGSLGSEASYALAFVCWAVFVRASHNLAAGIWAWTSLASRDKR